MAEDSEGKHFWSKFDEGEWDILQAYIAESEAPAEEVIAEVMQDRLSEGKAEFGSPFGLEFGPDEDD